MVVLLRIKLPVDGLIGEALRLHGLDVPLFAHQHQLRLGEIGGVSCPSLDGEATFLNLIHISARGAAAQVQRLAIGLIEETEGEIVAVVHELLGSDAGLPGLGLDLLAVLVRAGEEHDVLAPQAVIPGQRVRGHRTVGVADVELVRGIVDGRCDIEFFLFHGILSFKTAAPNGRAPVFA